MTELPKAPPLQEASMPKRVGLGVSAAVGAVTLIAAIIALLLIIAGVVLMVAGSGPTGVAAIILGVLLMFAASEVAKVIGPRKS